MDFAAPLDAGAPVLDETTLKGPARQGQRGSIAMLPDSSMEMSPMKQGSQVCGFRGSQLAAAGVALNPVNADMSIAAITNRFIETLLFE